MKTKIIGGQMRTNYLCTCAGLALGVTGVAVAQDAPRDASTEVIDQIVVTGSRIATGYETPTPVTIVSSEELALAAPRNLADGLMEQPMFQGSGGPGRTQTGTSLAANGTHLDLRNLGSLRTLVLLDGQRLPSQFYKGQVDISVVPDLLVERVEVVTGGASAVYGSDAVSGVVNFILDDDFVGLKTVGQYGISSRGDANNYRVGAAGGTSFAGGRGHIIGSLMRDEREGIRRRDRSLTAGNCNWLMVASIPTSTSPAGSPNNPYEARNCVGFNLFNYNGRFNSGPAGIAGTTWTPDGSALRPWDGGEYVGRGINQIGGDAVGASLRNHLVYDSEINQAFSRVSYRLTDNVTAFVQGSFSEFDYNVEAGSPALIFVPIFPGNAFLPQSVNLTSPAMYSKIFSEGASFKSPESVSSPAVTVGLKGSLGSDWTFDARYGYSRSKSQTNAHGDVLRFNMHAAIDAVDEGQFLTGTPNGNIVCRVTLTSPGLAPGCLPFNAFGDGNTTPEMFDYIQGVSSFASVNRMDDFAFSIQGRPFSTWAGPVGVAFTAEYRETSLDFTTNSDPMDLPDYGGANGVRYSLAPNAPTPLKFFVANVGPAKGSSNVKEAGFEVLMPLARDLPLVHGLDFNGAARYTDYSTSGDVTTWKAGLTFSPVEDLRFRYTKSRDIRAPTLFDLYASEQTSLGQPFDPVSNSSATLLTLSSGNPNLTVEKADTWTAGIVWQPRFLPGLSMSIDYYDIEIQDAITQYGQGTILDLCYQSGGTSAVCSLIDRPTPTSFPSSVRSAPINATRLTTSGIDAEMSYNTTALGGQWSMRAFATYVDEYESPASLLVDGINVAGWTGDGAGPVTPRLRGRLGVGYTRGPANLYIQGRYTSSLKTGPLNSYVDKELPSMFYTDATLRYNLESQWGSAELFLTGNNLFDKKPPVFTGNSNPGQSYPTIMGIYDVLGTTYTAGFRFTF